MWRMSATALPWARWIEARVTQAVHGHHRILQTDRPTEQLDLGAPTVVVVAYGLLVPEAVLAKGLWLNVHPSLLPRWRGAAPVERAIMAGDEETGVTVDVERPIHVRVRAQDERGGPLLIEASGLEARVIQHETDHLDGVLILDRTTRECRKEAMRTLREQEPVA